MKKRKKNERQQKAINEKILKKKIVKEKNKKTKHEFSESESEEEWSESETSVDNISEEGDSDKEPLAKIAKADKNIREADFYLVSFPGKKKAHNYICTVLNVLNENELEVQALCPVGEDKSTYRFIDGDISIISKNQLLQKLEQPKLFGTENRIKYKFSSHILGI